MIIEEYWNDTEGIKTKVIVITRGTKGRIACCV
jgi:hypothetical protein